MQHRRSIIIDGTVTSLSLESVFWEELDIRASEQGVAWQDYVRDLLADHPDPPNRAAAVRERLLRLLKEERREAPRHGSETWWNVRTPQGAREVGLRGNRFLVGRDFSNDLVVSDPEVSRRHALLVHDGQHWWVVDLKSKNGTWVNDKKCVARKITPKHVIKIGRSMICLAS